ncbi:MAG TPA: ATP-binding protein [Gemmatimonadales bacterium]|nr:ATP-binding protein [Gemmatimonadales bacterium]
MKLSHDRTILLLALLAGLPALAAAGVLLWQVPISGLLRGTLLGTLLLFWLVAARAAQLRVIRPLQVIANLLAGLREGHFTLRAREEESDDVLGAVRREVNSLQETLKEQRLGALEADALLRRVMEEIDVAVFAFDSERALRLVNRAGERLLAQPAERLIGRTAAQLGLEQTLEGETPRILELVVPGAATGKWEVRRRPFRQGGLPLEMVVLTDISRVLRSEERQVWQRLVRVLSHEINNSLAPIKSLTGTMTSLLDRVPRATDWETDLRKGLEVIATRSDALNRFMASYARLAKLPPPALAPLDVGDWVRRAIHLETRLPVRLIEGPPLTVRADGDQLDQVLINLLTNALEAARETGGGVEVSWAARDGMVEVEVRDEGPGLPSPGNLFVPFFTTKPSGSGIGLVFCRQVVEAHGGAVTLQNRSDRKGCVARIRLPRNA